MAVNVLTMSVH